MAPAEMRQKVLMVDDQPSNLLMQARMLKELDVDVLKTTKPAEALDLLATNDVALMLLDVHMPEIGGFELARRIGQDETLKDTPIIFITGEQGEESQVFEGYASGAVDYMLKPVEPNILRSKVRFFCELKRREMIIREQTDEIRRKNHDLEREMEERRQVEEAQQESEVRYRTLVELCPDAIMVQSGGEIIYFNASTMRLLGAHEHGAILGKSLSSFARPDLQEEMEDHLERVARQGGSWDAIESRLVRLDGEAVDVEMRCGCVLIEGEIAVQVAMLDITQRKQLEEELRRLTRQDGLTGVANRRHFNETLDREFRRAHRKGERLAVILMDIDHFKAFNDNYGHLAGDDCLREVAQALQQQVRRPGDTLARYGGEEFAAILPDTNLDGAAHVAEQMRAAVEELAIPHEHSSVAGVVTLSLGVASMLIGDDTSRDQATAAADQALYAAKDRGRNQLHLYLPSPV